LDLISRGEDGAQQAFSQNPGLLESFIVERDMWLRELKNAGVMLILGTDSGVGMGIIPGFSAHLELQAMVESGLTPFEAISTSTVNASKVVEKMVGVDEFGTIEVGKRADLILINENPLEDIANIQDILGVMADGQWYPRDALDKLIQLDHQ
jgi:imidazolonepropionase-like amidohydrolase